MKLFDHFTNWYQNVGVNITEETLRLSKVASETHYYGDILNATGMAFVYLIYGLLPYILFAGIALIPLWLVLFVGYKRMQKERCGD
ncbi:hypothetical protein [Priestia megaterium]|uniref:hypothetical protein n=1 Tax=Priestia megaterium TaxID=1404 RepID=UPI002E22C723|nr:hypothetical protein [Priestia megaterium]